LAAAAALETLDGLLEQSELLLGRQDHGVVVDRLHEFGSRSTRSGAYRPGHCRLQSRPRLCNLPLQLAFEHAVLR
jgi:hypothetical protein